MVQRMAAAGARGGTLFLVGHRPVDPATEAATAAAGQVHNQEVGVMQHAGLHPGQEPGGLDRLGEAFQPVADHHADVFDAAVADLGQHLQPGLGALPTPGRSDPDVQDVPFAVETRELG